MRALLLFLAVMSAVAEQDIPSLAPVVRSVFPHGIKKGSSAEVELAGQNLHETHSVVFSGPHVQATVLYSTASKVRLRVVAGANAETGIRDFRLTTPKGTYVGVFDIGSLEEIQETEPNDDPRRPQKIPLPVLVNGVVNNEDWDHFQFHVEDGETMAFDVVSTRNGSRLDADLAILDLHGRELAWNDDYYIFGDPRIEFRFEKGGDYIVRVGSLAGSPTSDYRLVAGRVPYASLALPSGLRRGKTTEVILRGSQLQNISAVWVGDQLAKGTILGKSPGEIRFSVAIPPSADLGGYWLHLAENQLEMPIPIPIVISDVAEVTLSAAPSKLANAFPIQTPVAVSGILTEHKGSHYFAFRAEAGQRFEFRVDSMRFGYHLDPVITILDASGRQLAAADDPGIDEKSDEFQLDPRLGYEFKQAGTYLIAVRDAMYRGDPRFVYRLSVLPDASDFSVEVREPLKTAYIGQKFDILLRVRRLGGWDSPVEVWIDDLPAGATSEKQVVQPKDSVVKDTCGVDRVIDGAIAHLSLRVDGLKPGLYHFTVKARGQSNGRTVEHTATIHYERYSAGYIYGPMRVQQIDLTVTPAPKVLLTVPEQVTVERGKSVPVKITAARFSGASHAALIIKTKSLPSGVALDAVRLAPDTKQVTMNIAVSSDAKSGEMPIVLSAETEQQQELGETSFLLRIAANKTELP